MDMGETNTGTCQICARNCKLPKGKISLHGYNRPGHGSINGRCYGAGFEAYEVSCERLRWFVSDVLQARRTHLVDAIARHQSDELTEVTVYPDPRAWRPHGTPAPEPKTYKRGEKQLNDWGCMVDNFADVVRNRIQGWETEIREIDRQIQTQTARINAWKSAQ